MNIGSRALISLAFMAGGLAAQTPTFSGVVNPASDFPPGVPNYGIAQGSVFIIYGTNLSTGGLVQASLPLPNSLNATAVTISQNNGSIITPIPILYTSPGQVAAIMPSTSPLGNVTLTVNNNGKAGSTQILVVSSAFGISTADGSGNGVGAVTFGSDYSYVTTNKSARPGDTLILWGTGLGALPAGVSDAQGAPLGNSASTIQVLVGGIPATVQYQGRSPGSVGLDQINFVVPDNAPLGCRISIVVQTTAPNVITSNGPTMAIGADNGVCTDPVQNLPQSQISAFTAPNAITKVLVVQAQQSTSYNFPQSGGAPVPDSSASVGAYLLSFSSAQISSQISKFNDTTSMNSCLTGVIRGGSPDDGPPVATGLDAGSSILLSSGANALSLPSVGTGFYQANLTGALQGGSYKLTSSGSTTVPPLNAAVLIPQSIVWTNLAQLFNSQVDRTKPLVINWTGGDPNAYVEIVGRAQLGPQNNPTYTIYFDCAAPGTAGTFSVPPAILANMPIGAGAYASITVNTSAIPTSIDAVPGFDLSLNLSQYEANIPVVYK